MMNFQPHLSIAIADLEIYDLRTTNTFRNMVFGETVRSRANLWLLSYFQLKKVIVLTVKYGALAIVITGHLFEWTLGAA